jgi:hypothetical protein
MFQHQGQLFHRLNQLNRPKPYCIKVENQRYFYSEVQLIFISLKTIHHFEKSTEKFIIEAQYLQDHSFQISLDDFIKCFYQFDLFFLRQLNLV